MFKFNNTHIFTGYLKQKLASINLPACKIYTKEFADYAAKHGTEDPRVIESIDTVVYNSEDKRLAGRVNYLKNNELYNYFWDYESYDKKADLGHSTCYWRPSARFFYDSEKAVPGFTKSLYSPGRFYDVTTHEYLGEYLRFLRDYHGIDLMSMYNCFSNNICTNIYYKQPIEVVNPNFDKTVVESAENPSKIESSWTFDSQDSRFKIYSIPVKLFANYTIAIDSSKGIELFCGLYNTSLDVSGKGIDLITRTYQKINKTIFKQPFLYDKLDVKNWLYDKKTKTKYSHPYESELHYVTNYDAASKQEVSSLQLNNDIMSRLDIATREQDLRLFIKVPVSCRSSITILEGDYREYNHSRYAPITDENSESKGMWKYSQNHAVLNFDLKSERPNTETINLNDILFKPIGKVQLLEFNTGESYPFADRLIEYLSDSTITPIDAISDNIKRAQRVMKHNGHYFRIEGLWENKIQQIIYDYIVNSGPVEVNKKTGKLEDKHRGSHPRLGHTTKSTLYDVLGYIDRNAEKWYACWKEQDGKAIIKNSIQNVDIYVDKNGRSLYGDF